MKTHIHHAVSGAVSFVGKPAVDVYAALAIASGLKFYAKTGMKINRMYTPANMRRKAEELTGQKFKARDYAGMEAALRAYAATSRAGIEEVAELPNGDTMTRRPA